jgi:hypothetical protein
MLPSGAMPTKKPPKKPGPRADFGAPIDDTIAKSPHRAMLEELRALIDKAAPEATASLKWGMPNFSIGGTMMCQLGVHKAHVNLVLAGPAGTYADPKGLLEGEGKMGRHLRLVAGAPIPRADVVRWLAAAAKHARNP